MQNDVKKVVPLLFPFLVFLLLTLNKKMFTGDDHDLIFGKIIHQIILQILRTI